MAMPRARAIGVGAFVIGGVLLFAIGLFMIGNRRMLFNQSIEVHASFKRIAGLQSGAKVRVAGMDAGEVTEIHVPRGPSGQFLIVMRVRSDLHPLVRTDSVASIQNDGLVGAKFVQIETGTEGAPPVSDHGAIQSSEPFEFADLLQKMSDTVDSVNETIDDVQAQVNETLTAVTSTALTTQRLVQQVSGNVRAIAASGQRVSADVSAIIAGVRNGRGTAGRLLTDDELYQRAADIAAKAQAAATNVRDATEQAKKAIADLRTKGGPAEGVTSNLNATLSSAREAMDDLAENAEALKHNFFFRGFFKNRGYFDLDAISVQQYRDGALERSGRVPLRIWLTAGVLFHTTPDGREALTDAGRERLDSAMSQFVRFPRSSPLVVEAYAPEATAGARFRASRQRGELVREYLSTRFGLDRERTTVMAMGSVASNSPSGDSWDGIALALFVEKDVFNSDGSVAQDLIKRR
jgi:phospholipid/cholesterol/gamma-HCH transport system substrate-binding protein